jgi:hypothetical protein
MNRSFPSTTREASRAGLVGVLICGAAACTPNQNVKPGAPELVEFTIVQAGPSATTIKPDTPDCAAGVVTGSACLPMGRMADAADGGMFDANVPPDTLCRQASADNWCTCMPDGMNPNQGTWGCEPFTNVLAVIAVFDRLLDTAPLDPGDAAGLTTILTTSATAGSPPVDLVTDYSSTGDPNGLIFNVFGPFFGNFRANGPSLFGAPQPEFPSGATVMVSIQGDKVRAKDGTTPFTGSGQLLGGTLVFTMAPFAATLAKPDAMAMDPNAATLMFTNLADPTGHITATSNGAPIMIDTTTNDGATYAVTPMGGGPWPAGATIVITLDASTQNLLGQTIAAAATVTFTAAQ